MGNTYVDKLLEDGYAIIPQAFRQDIISQLLQKLQSIIIEIKKQNSDFTRGYGYYYDLQNEDVLFIKSIFNHEVLRSTLITLLNDPYYRNIPEGKPNYIFRGIRTREASEKGLPLHIDSVMPSSSIYPTSIVTSTILEDHTEANGATLIVSKSHRSDKFADRNSKDAIPIIANAGDIVLWDSRLWHGSMDNPDRNSRFAILCGFSRWHIKQPFRHTETLPNHIYQQLSDEEKSIIGYCAIPALDTYERADDGKAGYGILEEVTQ